MALTRNTTITRSASSKPVNPRSIRIQKLALEKKLEQDVAAAILRFQQKVALERAENQKTNEPAFTDEDVVIVNASSTEYDDMPTLEVEEEGEVIVIAY